MLALGTIREACQLPTWDIIAKESPRGGKRLLEEDSSSSTTAKRRCGRLTLLLGTFRPLIVLDDEGGAADCPVVPRPLLRGRSTHRAVLIEDDSASKSTGPSVTPDAVERILAPRIVSGATTEFVGQNHKKNLEAARCGIIGDYNSKTANQNTDRLLAAEFLSLESPLSPYVWSELIGEQDESNIRWLLEQKHDTAVAVPKVPKNNLSVKDQKRFFIEMPTTALAGAMAKWVSSIYKILDLWRSDEEC